MKLRKWKDGETCPTRDFVAVQRWTGCDPQLMACAPLATLDGKRPDYLDGGSVFCWFYQDELIGEIYDALDEAVDFKPALAHILREGEE